MLEKSTFYLLPVVDPVGQAAVRDDLCPLAILSTEWEPEFATLLTSSNLRREQSCR